MPIYTVRFQETISYSLQVNADSEEEAANFVSQEIKNIGIEAMNPRIDNIDVEVWDCEASSPHKIRPDFRSSDKTIPYHPEYGLPDSLRSEVLTLARESGIKMAAAFYGVAVSSVYRWRKDLGI
jgi:hypothetical protein